MDHLEQAKNLYRKYHDPASDLSHNERQALSLTISKLIHTCLVQHGGVTTLSMQFIHVIQKTVAANLFQGELAAAAFRVLEKYLVLLFGQPWKREFWRLKTYGGYFCTKVKAHLDNPEEILQLVGYLQEEEATNGSCLVLDHCPDSELVLNVAFDCQVAAEECQQIGEYYDKMKCVGLSLSDAMKVMLSGAPIDPMVGTGVGMLPARTMQLGQSSLDKQSGGRVDGAQTIMASGGMGMGIVMGASTMHQVTGVPATRPVSAMKSRHLGLQQPNILPGPTPMSAPSQYSYPLTADQPGVGLKVDLPQASHQGRVAEVQFRIHPNSPCVAGSRASYASSAGGQSSGYGSGAASELSAPSSAYTASSAFTASSGYNSGMLPQSQVSGQNYVYLPHVRGGDHVDSPLVTTSNSPRHSRPLPVPQAPPPDFPYIDEEEPGVRNQFPEATHEEHLRESLRNLQTGPPEQGMSKAAVVMPPPSSDVIGRQSAVVRDGVPVSYDDWQWFPKHAGVGHNTMAGTGGMMVNRLPHAMHPASDIMRLPPSQQPATAVTAMNPSQGLANANSMMKRHVSPMDGRQQMAQSGPNSPLTVVGNAVAPVPSSTTKSSVSSGYVPHDSSRFVAPQPVYYPPPCNEVPFQQYANTDAGPPLQPKPTFAQKVVSARPADKSALLSRQAQGSPATILNNLDKGQQVRPGRETLGTSSEVLIREKATGRAGHVRGSSLVLQQDTNQLRAAGTSRQSSHSMDLGKLKWRCQTCTMENSAMENICSACSKTRDAPEMQFPGPGETKRACPVCTFENPSGCSKCEMCANPLSPDVHTYV